MPGREKRKKKSTLSNPLGEDLNADRFASLKRASGAGDPSLAGQFQEEDGGFLIAKKASQRLLRTAREQLEATSLEVNANEADEDADEVANAGGARARNAETDAVLRELGLEGYDDEEDGEMMVEYSDSESVASDIPESMMMDGDFDPASLGIDEEEARLLEVFRPKSQVQTRNLADMIMEKIHEKEEATRRAAGADGDEADDGGDEGQKIDRRVVRVYSAIGTILKRYSSGKIPKAFKVLPHIQNWEQLLMITRPDEWSPHATYQATRIFTANLNERMAQRFYASILLPIVHHYLLEEKKLHPSLYMAVRKALFKPVAFYKGFLLPLAQDEECTLKEALVVASVLQRSHLPPVPTAVMIVKISTLPFSGPCSVFLRVLIDKKMALPYQAIDALVKYFHRFVKTHSTEERLPVLWHQTLLSFTQRYKEDFTPEQVDLLSKVCAKHFHHMITPEIRRELVVAQRNSRNGANAARA